MLDVMRWAQEQYAECLLDAPMAEEARKYLEKLGFAADEIRSAPPNALGVRGTPTLILTDSKGAAVNSWIGKLPAAKENEVLKAVHL